MELPPLPDVLLDKDLPQVDLLSLHEPTKAAIGAADLANSPRGESAEKSVETTAPRTTVQLAGNFLAPLSPDRNHAALARVLAERLGIAPQPAALQQTRAIGGDPNPA